MRIAPPGQTAQTTGAVQLLLRPRFATLEWILATITFGRFPAVDGSMDAKSVGTWILATVTFGRFPAVDGSMAAKSVGTIIFLNPAQHGQISALVTRKWKRCKFAPLGKLLFT